MRLRRKDADAQTAETAAAEARDQAPAPTGPRADGPWDRSEKEPTPQHIDLGALLIRGRVGLDLRSPADEDGTRNAVVLLTEDAGVELRAFAAPRSGGLWDEVRPELVAEVARLEGEVDEVDGIFGSELRIRIPATTPDGQPAVQPTRIVAVEGPRWMLRATFLGRAALDPSDEGLLVDTFRDTIVVRGAEPRISREALPVVTKTGAAAADADAAASRVDEPRT